MAAPRPRYRALAREVASYDPWLLTAVLALCGIGLVMVLSASSVLAASRYHDAFHLFKRQCLSLGLGLGLMTLCRFLPLGFYRRLAYPALIASLILLGLVLIPGLGHQAGGAPYQGRLGYHHRLRALVQQRDGGDRFARFPLRVVFEIRQRVQGPVAGLQRRPDVGDAGFHPVLPLDQHHLHAD